MGFTRVAVGAAVVAVLGGGVVPALASANGRQAITGRGTATQDDIGTCNNAWATDHLKKRFKLKRVHGGGYNLNVKESGGFTTNAGPSPGACESGADNGNTVAAGITGNEHQTFNAPVTATHAPNPHPDCSGNACGSSGGFLDAVFGAGNWHRGTWSWTGRYEAGSHGRWFDTSVNWPSNDRGDITS